MTIRYIADLHFDDESILAYDNRPFDTVAEMNEAMIRNWNRVVAETDLTWILGDFCGGSAARWAELLSKLQGRKSLIIGNHDDCEAVKQGSDLFEEIAEYREIRDGDRQVVLCHYPIVSFHDHYFSWVHFYGHVHSSYEWHMAEKEKSLMKKLYARKDVCLMANVGAMMPYMTYTPRSLEELIPHC